MKRCSKCGEVKGLDCFYKNKAMKDGFNYYCKDCIRKINKINKKNTFFKITRTYVANNLGITVKDLTEEMYLSQKHKINELRLFKKFQSDLFTLGFKACTKCKKVRKIFNFYHDDRRKQKLSHYCKDCCAQSSKKLSNELYRSYVAYKFGIKKSELTDDLYQLKKQQLEVHRLIKQLNKEIKNGNQ